MKRFFRRLRGALSIGASWGAAWATLGAVHGFLVGVLNPRYWTLANPIVDTALGYGIAGFIAGTGFASLLWWRGRDRTIESLSSRRLAVLGAVGGALVPVLVHLTRGITSSDGWTYVGGVAVVTGVLGAISAVLTLRVARRAPTVGEADAADAALLSEPLPEWVNERQGAEDRPSAQAGRNRRDA